MGAFINRLKGKAKQLEGKLTGNNVQVAQGTAQNAMGGVEGAASRVARRAMRAVRGMTSRANAGRGR